MILSDRYELISEIGKGGMSTVYLAKDKTLGSFWAVKRVENNKSVDLASFKKEVELLSSLQHSDIPRIVDRVEIENN
ncbi:MAG: serine/threonine protein kinase, partial [Crenarchaeota archaeon]|nr:serine/threonine protein kinase [Thermoproteota archaeon]